MRTHYLVGGDCPVGPDRPDRVGRGKGPSLSSPALRVRPIPEPGPRMTGTRRPSGTTFSSLSLTGRPGSVPRDRGGPPG